MLILSLYNFIICLVAAVLYVVVNKLEPNPCLATGVNLILHIEAKEDQEAKVGWPGGVYDFSATANDIL
jgi:hypothetical protein